MTDEGKDRRPISDTILLVLTLTVCISLVVGVFGIITVRIVDKDAPVGIAASSLGTLLSAIAGYVIGRRGTNGHA